MNRRIMRTKLPDHRCRQKLKQSVQTMNPETVQEYFQISVNLLEARKLAWASPHSFNSYVVIMLGKEKYKTSIRKNTEEPCYKEYFLFEWYASVREVQRTSLWLAVMEPKCCVQPRLLGEATIDLAAIWAQPNHQLFHKWAQLNRPQDPEAGAVGFLKVDISIVCRGDIQFTPMIINRQDISEKSILPLSPDMADLEQQTANFLITIYGAYNLSVSEGDSRYCKPPNTYAKVSFCGLTGKTAVLYRTCNPTYNEQISIVEAFPNTSQLIRIEVYSTEAGSNRVLASADMRLGSISHDGENGFVPTFGPSLLHMYSNTPHGFEASGEDGPYYKGALLVALKTVVPYYQKGLRSTNVEPVTPVLMDSLWTWDDYSLLCPIFEVSMLDKRIVGKLSGVALTVGELPCTFKKDQESKKLYYTGCLNVSQTSPAYGHLDLSTFPVLQMATRLPDFRFRMFTNNVVAAIAAELEKTIISLEKMVSNVQHCTIICKLVDELSNAVENAVASIRKFIETLSDLVDQKPESHKTELDLKQLLLQKEEMKKIYHKLTKKVKDNSTMNLMGLVSRTSRDSSTVTKKEMKSLLAEARTLTKTIYNLVFASADSWPDIVVWLLNGPSRVAYYKIPIADVLFSEKPEQCGKYCGRIQTIYMKPLKCPKHLNTVPTNCTCIAGKIEMLLWMGLFNQKYMFECCLPKAYKLKVKEFDMCLKTTMMVFQCRIFINRAKLINDSESSSLPCSFVRINALNSVTETKIQPNTVTPIWNVVLKMQKLTYISQYRLKSYPPTVLVEVFESDIMGRNEIIGRIEIMPELGDKPSYEYAPKLQWHEIHRGHEKTGQILMSAQILQVPETLVKSTIYTSVDETCNETINADMCHDDLSVQDLPLCLMPKSNTYKVDIYWWGLRGISVTKKPCAILEIDDLIIKSDIISERKPNCNFPNGRTSHLFQASLNESYCPPLQIKICDSNTFGRTLFMGTKVVKNPNKYIVDWLPKYAREASLRSVSIMSSNFLRVSDNIYIKKSATFSEISSQSKVTANSSSFFQVRKKIPVWKRLFTKNVNEEFVLLPVFTKIIEQPSLPDKVPAPELQDWWMRFFASLKDRISDESNSGNIKIYQSELELQPEFSKFKDWCKTLKLYSGTKSGIAERDVKLQCGFMKVGIAIYKWPPPSHTVALSSNGVELVQGYFDDYPANEAVKYLVRVYIVRGLNLIARSFTGQSDPYIVINCGTKHSEDNNRSISNTLNPVFGKIYEFECGLPEDYLLTVSLYDHEALSPDDLIGSTSIDLEDRIYSKHRARVGLAMDYKALGSAKWRDCVKPSAILEEVCLKNHIPAPIFLDNNAVIVNGVQYKDTDETNKTYISASERKENICLELLHKWHTLPICGYQLVPEHVETRRLFNPDKPGVEQGKIQMWIDMFPMDTGSYIPLPVNIAPRKVVDYELRLTVWSVQGALITTKKKRREENIKKDIYVKAWIGCEEQAQYTDIYYQTVNGESIFNWRMIFHFQYQNADKTMIVRDKGTFTEEEEHLPPVLILQVIDSDAAYNEENLGTLTLNLNSIPRGPKSEEYKLYTLDNTKRINLFSMRSINGWWPLKRIDRNTGTSLYAGVINMELSLLPKEVALIAPVGLGRDAPYPLPVPDRPKSDEGMAKAGILQTLFSSTGIEYCVIGAVLLGAFAATIYLTH